MEGKGSWFGAVVTLWSSETVDRSARGVGICILSSLFSDAGEMRVCVDVNCRRGELKTDVMRTFGAARKDLAEKNNDVVAFCMLPGMNYFVQPRTEGLVSGLKFIGHRFVFLLKFAAIRSVRGWLALDVPSRVAKLKIPQRSLDLVRY